ncbi:MAG: antitoxin [Solirubrobacterales bacterium]|nr:antitoxin [Solirubrobacterales bacterium]
MSKQIAVRLPEELVEFVDATVSAGGARSRAAVVTRALERERRRAVAARDVELLAAAGEDEELVAFSAAASGLPLGLD